MAAHKNLAFKVTEQTLEIFGDENPISLNVNGQIIRLQSLSYDETHGFAVRMQTGLWGNLGGREIEATVRLKLQQMYGAKMRATLQQIRVLKRQRTVSDAQKVIDEITKIFANP